MQEVGDFFNNNFVNVSYDAEKEGEVEIFKKEYKSELKGYPTHLFIDPKTKEIVHKFVGGRAVKDYINEGKSAQKREGLVFHQSEYDKGNRDIDFMLDYIAALNNAGNRAVASSLVNGYYIEQGDDVGKISDEKKIKLYTSYIVHLDVNDKLYSDLLKANSTPSVSKLIKNSKVNDDIMRVLSTKVIAYTGMKIDESGRAVFNSQDKARGELLNRHLRYYVTSQSMCSPQALMQLHLATIEGDFRKSRMFVLVSTDLELRNFVSYDILKKYYTYILQNTEDKALLSDMLEDAKNYQSKQERVFTTFTIYDLIANLYDKLGDKAKCKEALKTHKEITDRNVREKEQRERGLPKKKKK